MVTIDCVILICVEESGEQRSKCSVVGVGSHGREVSSCGGEEVGYCAVVERRWIAVVGNGNNGLYREEGMLVVR